MQTSNTAEMVTISRAEYERFQEQAQVITSLTLQNEWLLEQLKLSKKKLFGRSSEQAEQMVMEQLSFTYNEEEAYASGTKAAAEKPVAVKAHERKRQSGNVLDVVPEGTPTEVVEHRLPENERICSACGSELVEIGKDVRWTLQMKPAEFWIREDVYYTYACKNCEQETGEANIVKAAKEPALLPGSFASAEAVAYLAAQKFVMYSPLYRLEQEKPVLDALLSWANEMQAKTAPKSALGRAIHYLLEQWPYLTRYLEDGRLELSNNRAERSIKPFVMGRKNWLFANTSGGARASSLIYSLMETAKENGLDPYRYLLWLLQNAPQLSETDEAWAEKLLPANAPEEYYMP